MEGGEKDQLTTLRSKMVEPMTNYNSRFPDVRVRKGRGMEGKGRRERGKEGGREGHGERGVGQADHPSVQDGGTHDQLQLQVP